jgi:antitoxin component YwqK of YwqJK toxin-antitoxin module
MNYLLAAFILFCTLQKLFSQRIEVNKTEFKLGVLYNYKNEPVNGIVYDVYKKKKIKWEREYKNGKENGFSKEWDENGNIVSQCHYIDGKKDGNRKYYFSNGKLFFEENYLNGNLHGRYTIFNNNGQLILECNFLDGNLDGEYKTWHNNGKLKSQTFFSKNELHGIRKVWYENEVLESENTFNFNKENGISKSWFENGQLKFEKTFTNGKSVGKQRFLNEKGEVLAESDLLNGNGSILLKDLEGNIYYEQVYKDSLIQIEKFWDKNGNLIYQVDNEITKVWFSNGQLCSEKQFIDKKLIDQKCWFSDGRIYSETELNSNFCTSDIDNDKVCDCDDYCPETPGELNNNGRPINPVKGTFSPANFPSGENVFQEFLATNLLFPEPCMEMDAQGRILMSFIVDPTGKIKEIEVESNRTGCHDFVEEAQRVLSIMPLWFPAEYNGQLKQTLCRLPFNFRIN